MNKYRAMALEAAKIIGAEHTNKGAFAKKGMLVFETKGGKFVYFDEHHFIVDLAKNLLKDIEVIYLGGNTFKQEMIDEDKEKLWKIILQFEIIDDDIKPSFRILTSLPERYIFYINMVKKILLNRDLHREVDGAREYVNREHKKM